MNEPHILISEAAARESIVEVVSPLRERLSGLEAQNDIFRSLLVRFVGQVDDIWGDEAADIPALRKIAEQARTALGTEARSAETSGSAEGKSPADLSATPEATPKSSPSQTPVDPQMTVEEAREAFARLRAEADRDFDEDLMPGGFN